MFIHLWVPWDCCIEDWHDWYDSAIVGIMIVSLIGKAFVLWLRNALVVLFTSHGPNAMVIVVHCWVNRSDPGSTLDTAASLDSMMRLNLDGVNGSCFYSSVFLFNFHLNWELKDIPPDVQTALDINVLVRMFTVYIIVFTKLLLLIICWSKSHFEQAKHHLEKLHLRFKKKITLSFYLFRRASLNWYIRARYIILMITLY